MSITKDNYRNFYFGSAAELFVQSEFYTFGFEAYKTQPDTGFDLCVTNNALVKFHACERKMFNVQVKARLVNAPETAFLIPAEEFEMLMNDKTGVLVCVLGFPKIAPAWNWFDYSNHREPSLITDNTLDWSGMQYYFAEDTYLAVNEAEDNYNIVGYEKSYFWLNNAHLARLLDGGYFTEYEYKGQLYKRIKMLVAKSDEISFYIDDTDCALSIASEIQSLKYLVDEKVACREDLDRGKLFEMDPFDSSL